MKREIKFRAWAYTSYGGWDMRYSGLHGSLAGFFREHEDDALMQYTGLKDKNGVEIYEGDIVCGERTYMNHAERFPVCVVLHDGWSFHIKPLGSCTEHYAFFDDNSLEIIGNIHENPELLQDAAGKSNQEGNQQWTTSPNSSTPTPTADPTSRAS